MNLTPSGADIMLSALGAALIGGKLSYYSAPQPSLGGATTLLIAQGTITSVVGPSAGVLALPAEFEAQRLSPGVIAWARLTSSAGVPLIDLQVGITGGGAAITLDRLDGYTGAFVKLTSSTLSLA